MSFSVSRDIFGMDFEDPLRDLIDKIDDQIIEKYQLGWVHDEFGNDWDIEKAREYYKERNIPFFIPEPSSYDALLILYKMIESGEVEFNPRRPRGAKRGNVQS
jgi:predicted 3-demethylubiquinone-9 3-methyltransferase (glyoxalase superfamily)